jgi:hypothetical protein
MTFPDDLRLQAAQCRVVADRYANPRRPQWDLLAAQLEGQARAIDDSHATTEAYEHIRSGWNSPINLNEDSHLPLDAAARAASGKPLEVTALPEARLDRRHLPAAERKVIGQTVITDWPW